jgi:hypothetical protein
MHWRFGPRPSVAVEREHRVAKGRVDSPARVLSIACGFVAVGYIAKVVANAVVRLREPR